MACPISALSQADVSKQVEIKNGTLSVNGINRAVKWRKEWRKARHEDSKGKIVSVETRFKGKVTLDNGKVFENPASKDDNRPFDKDCYRSKLCHSPKVCASWKRAVCSSMMLSPSYMP